MIWSLPNGLQGYALFGAWNQRRVDAAFPRRGRGDAITTVIASKRNVRYRPYVFTEHGALMLSSVLKSERAAKMGI